MAEPEPIFNQTYWEGLITKPTWYFAYVDFRDWASDRLGKDSKELKDLTKQLRSFFEQALLAGKVALASEGPNLDKERKPVDTVVIHHTSSEPGERLSYMNAIQLLNIYAPYFANPTDPKEKFLKGQPLWSNHVQNGRAVFYAYHWLMRMDGSFERLLKDKQLGWHAANWDINTHSVAICLDNDYEHQDPPQEVLQKLAGFITKNYPGVAAENIIGHKEAAKAAGKDTICPGGNFLDGWKSILLELVEQAG
jgi:hypothetical protein